MTPRTPRPDADRLELVQGTLDMLVLRTLLWGPAHGHGIAVAIERASGSLRIDHGSPYPALQRLEQEGWIAASWGTSDHNRRAKFYRLTPAGRRHLHAEEGRWNRLVEAIRRVMRPAPGEGS